MKVPFPWGCGCHRARVSGLLSAWVLAERTSRWEVVIQDMEKANCDHSMSMKYPREEAHPSAVALKVAQHLVASKVGTGVLEALAGWVER